MGMYTFIISLIQYAGGSLPEAKLDRYLKRMNAEQSTPAGKKDALLQRLVKEQYLVKIRDTTSGEELIEYMVGPRGKVEVGKEGTANMTRKVFGSGVDNDDLEKRIERSLGLGAERDAAKNREADATSTQPAAPTQRKKSRRQQGGEEDAEEEEYEE